MLCCCIDSFRLSSAEQWKNCTELSQCYWNWLPRFSITFHTIQLDKFNKIRSIATESILHSP